MYAPEIEIFNPPQPKREATSSLPSPTWQRSSPTVEMASPDLATGGGLGNGLAVVEEASAAQSMSVKQRGARLSFLNGRRKESKEWNHSENGVSTGDADTNSISSRGKEGNRKSFFRVQSTDTNGSMNPFTHPTYSSEAMGSDGADGLSRKNSEVTEVVDKGHEKAFDPGLPRMGSVRKRLSMLKIGGKKLPRTGTMGDVEE